MNHFKLFTIIIVILINYIYYNQAEVASGGTKVSEQL